MACGRDCQLDPYKYDGVGRGPKIVIMDRIDNCDYKVWGDLLFSFWGEWEGVLTATQDSFFIRMDSVGGAPVLFLDFTKEEQGRYSIITTYRNSVTVRVDKIYQRLSKGDVYVFRFEDAHELMEGKL